MFRARCPSHWPIGQKAHPASPRSQGRCWHADCSQRPQTMSVIAPALSIGDAVTPLSFPTSPVTVLQAPADTAFLDLYRPAVIQGWLEEWPLYRDLRGR